MPEKKQNPIIRTEIFVVDHSETNNYGNLIVTPKEDGGVTTKTYKVGNKRSSLFDVFQPDTAVEVGYSEYMNREYIASARQVKDAIPDKPVKLPEPAPRIVESSIPKPEPKPEIAPQPVGKFYKADPAKTDSIERQVSIKLACDISSDTESLDQIFIKADRIYQWIKGE